MIVIGAVIILSGWVGFLIYCLFHPIEPIGYGPYYTPWGEEVDFGDWHRVQYYYNGDWTLFAPERYQQRINWQREGF